MTEDTTAYVGLRVAKTSQAVAVAESGRQGQVQFMGEADPDAVRRFVTDAIIAARRPGDRGMMAAVERVFS